MVITIVAISLNDMHDFAPAMTNNGVQNTLIDLACLGAETEWLLNNCVNVRVESHELRRSVTDIEAFKKEIIVSLKGNLEDPIKITEYKLRWAK